MNNEMLEMLKKLPPVNVLNPVIPENKIKCIAELTNCGIDYRHIIDVAVSLTLTSLLFEEGKLNQEKFNTCRELASNAGNFLARECTEDWQRILSVTFLAKGMVKSLLDSKVDSKVFGFKGCIEMPAGENESGIFNIFLPSIDSDLIAKISASCCKSNITPVELLDVGLSWLNVDRLIAYDSITRQTTYLDFQRLKEAAGIGKLLNQFYRSRENQPENILTSNLIVLRVCITNLLGECAGNNFKIS